MGKLWQRSRDSDNKSRLTEVALGSLRVDKPSVFFLTGFFTTDSARQNIAGSIKAVETLLARNGAAQKMPEIYAWSHSGLSEFFNFAAYNALPSRAASCNGHDLAKAIILPLVASDLRVDAGGDVTGRPLPPDVARENLRNVTFFGYSAGTITAQECYNASLSLMRDIGYSKAEAKTILSEVVLISAGVMSRPAKEGDRFTTIFLAASNDRLVLMKERVWEPLRALFSWMTKKLRIEKLSDRSIMVSAPVRKRGWALKTEGDKSFREKFNGLVPAWLPARSNHELKRYVTEDESSSPFARIIRYALTNALSRDGLRAPLDLLQPPRDVPPAETEHYRAGILAAQQPRRNWFRHK